MRNQRKVALNNKTETEILDGINGSYYYNPLHASVDDAITNVTGFPTTTVAGTATNLYTTTPGWVTGNGTDLSLEGMAATEVKDFLDVSTLGDGYILVSMWLYGNFGSIAQSTPITFGFVGSAGEKGFKVDTLANGKAQFSVAADTTTNVVFQTPLPVNTPTHFLAWIKLNGSDAEFSYYIDGVAYSVGAKTATGTFDASDDFGAKELTFIAGFTGADAIKQPIPYAMSDILLIRTNNDIGDNLARIATELAAIREIPQSLSSLI